MVQTSLLSLAKLVPAAGLCTQREQKLQYESFLQHVGDPNRSAANQYMRSS